MDRASSSIAGSSWRAAMSIAKLCGACLPFARSARHAMTTLLLDLLAHMRWADALVADALSTSARQPERTRAADPIALFAHIAGTEHLWYSRITGTPPECPVWPEISVAESRVIAQ